MQAHITLRANCVDGVRVATAAKGGSSNGDIRGGRRLRWCLLAELIRVGILLHPAGVSLTLVATASCQ